MFVRNPPKALFGCATLLLGAAVLFLARKIPVGFGYDVVGPAMFPTIIGAGLTLSGLLAIFEARVNEDVEAMPPVDLLPVAIICAALLIEAAAIRSLGWIPMTGLLFLAGAWGFGDRRITLNLGIGLAMGAAILAAFDYGLGLDLPLGPLDALLPPAG